jgi:hypothetical protein
MIRAAPLNFLLNPHRYMRPNHRDDSFLFVHHTPDGIISCPFSPCTWCDFRTISLARNVRKLHLEFGDLHHCTMGPIEGICRLAIEEMHHLECLVLTLSNYWCIYGDGYAAVLTNKINEATQETGRLLLVNSKAFSNGPDHEDSASESRFWQTTEPRSHLCWVDDWAKKIAEDEAAAEALFGKRRLTMATTTPATTALATKAPATTAPISTTPIANADVTEDASSELDFDEQLDFDDALDFDDSGPDEEYFDYFMPAPQLVILLGCPVCLNLIFSTTSCLHAVLDLPGFRCLNAFNGLHAFHDLNASHGFYEFIVSPYSWHLRVQDVC